MKSQRNSSLASLILGSLLTLSFSLNAQDVWLENVAGISFSIGTHMVNSIDMDYADFDGDGDRDLVVVNMKEEKASIEIYLNSGAWKFMFVKGYELTSDISTAVKAGDVDNDGDADIVLANFSGKNHVYYNEGNMHFKPHHSHFGHTAGTIHDLELADMNGDGFLDILLSHHKRVNEIAMNDGHGHFHKVIPFGKSFATSNQLAVADLNGDGFPDMVEVNDRNQANFMFLSTGKEGNWAIKDIGGSKVASKAVELGDMNGDGNTDIIIGNSGAPSKVIFLSKEGKVLSEAVFGTEEDLTMDIALADMNGDSKLDIITANDGHPNTMYKNVDNKGRFDRQDLNDRTFRTTSIFAFDMNDDGLIDVAETNLHALNVYYLNRGEFNSNSASINNK